MTYTGELIQGIVLGAITSLTAMGLVLVYRSSRIVNFAQAEMGGLAAAAAVEATIAGHLPYVAAVGIGLVVALATGALVDIVVVRQLSDAPKLMLTVATIGVAEIVGAGEVRLGRLHATRAVSSFTVPFHTSIHIGGFTFNGNHLVAIAVVLACMAGLTWFLEGTNRGAAMQAIADSREKALLLGIRVRVLSLTTWCIAAVLSGIGAILAQPVLGVTVGQTAGPTSLLAPLAAAVIGRMRSVRIAVGASVGVGIFEQLVLRWTRSSSSVDVALFFLILAVLLVQSKGEARSDGADIGTFEAMQQVRRLVTGLRESLRVRTLEVLLGIGVLALVVGGPFALNRKDLIFTSNMAIYAIVAVSLTVLTGWAGQISLGQFAFVGVGGALCGALLVHNHWNLLLDLACGMVTGGILAVVVGLPALRIPGLMLSVTTLAFAVPVSTYLLGGRNVAWLNPPSVPRPYLFGRIDLSSQRTFYLFCLGCLLIVVFLARNLRLSRTGRAILAVRDNPEGAAAYGIRPVRTRLTAFAIAGGFAGLAGGLYVVGLGGLGPSSGGLDPELSLFVFTMVAIGGTGSLLGGIMGAAYLESVVYFLPADWQLFATGAGLLLLVLAFPAGLGAMAYALRDRIVARVARPRMLHPARRRVTTLTRAAAAMRDLELSIPDEQRDRLVRVQGEGTVRSGTELLGCSGVRAGYGRTEVLHGVTMSIGPGEMVALLGPNGSGKTTLLRTMAGLNHPASGSVRFRGRRLRRYSTARRVEQGVVVVLGGRSIFPSLSVDQNLHLGAWLIRHDPESVEGGIEWVLSLFPALAARRRVRAGLLSGGEQQMLALAQALLCKPRVLLVDEMSLGLAPVVIHQLLHVVRELAAAGVGVLLVEQSMTVATSLCDRIVLLERGVLVFGGPPPDLAARPELMRSVFLRSAQEAARRAVTRPSPDGSTNSPAQLPALSLRKVSKSYGGVRAVDSVDLVLPAGTVLGLVGPNGSGKTTLLDLCSGYLSPDSGTIGLFGREVSRLSPAERSLIGVGRLFQNARLFPTLTVTEAVCVSLERRVPLRDPLAAALRVADAARSERAVLEMAEAALGEVQLLPWRDHLVSELSTGLRRLLEIACVLAHRPRLLLLDEPSAGIAQRERGALADVILSLRESTGATFVLVEHDVPLVSRIADQVAFMNLGAVVTVAPPAEVFSDPAVIDIYLGSDEPTHLPRPPAVAIA